MKVLVLGVLLAAWSSVAAARQADDGAQWRQVYREDDITVWVRDVPVSGLHEIRARVVIEAPALRVWSVLNDTARFTEFMPYVVEARIVAPAADGHIEYQRIDPPFVGQRDYIVRVTSEHDAASGTRWRRWSAVGARGPSPIDGVVRIEVNEGEWAVRADGEGRSIASYYLYTDPGGAIPAWIANRANRSTVPKLMEAVRQRSIDPDWRPAR